MRRRLPRVAWPLLGLAAGLAAAALLTAIQEPVYRADAAIVLVREGPPPGSDPALAAAAGAAALFDSRAVAASAIANLGLQEPPDDLVDRLDAEAEPESSLVRLRVDAPSGDDALLRVHALDGRLLRTRAVPAGSYNVQHGHRWILTPSLSRGTLCTFSPRGAPLHEVRVALSSHDACFVVGT